MKVLINGVFEDLSLIKSISKLEFGSYCPFIDGSIGYIYKGARLTMSGLEELEAYDICTGFTISYITNIPERKINVPSPKFTFKWDVEDHLRRQSFIDYWIEWGKQIERSNERAEEEYNKLIEMWSNTKPSDIIKFNFE